MLSIRNGVSLARALASPVDPRIKNLLRKRRDQLGGGITDQAHFVLVQGGDALPDLEQALSFSVFQNAADGSQFGDANFTPGWEWIEDHGCCFELVFMFDDSGFAHVVLVEKAGGVNPELLSLCATYASENA